MPFFPLSRLSNYRLLVVLGIFASLASGCQSSRPSFSFRPGPRQQHEVSTTTAAAPKADAVPVEGAPVAPAASPSDLPPVARQQRHPSQLGLAALATEKVVRRTIVRPHAPHQRPLLARPHATAEAGLGTTVLGVLGLVVLPIALLGLLLSGGGLVWGIVAAAAALAVLVAYLDPFGRH